jgi:hypothetical protein
VSFAFLQCRAVVRCFSPAGIIIFLQGFKPCELSEAQLLLTGICCYCIVAITQHDCY